MREGGGVGGVPFERMDHAHLIQGFSDQTKVADAHFFVSVVADYEAEPGRDDVASLKRWLG